MTEDERQIRELVANWWSASQAGDTETVLSLMTEDALFLVAGRAPMNKSEFAALSRAAAGGTRPSIESHADIQEVTVSGDLAYLWAALEVEVLPPGAASPFRRAGHTLTVFRRTGGRWLLARDANLLVTQP